MHLLALRGSETLSGPEKTCLSLQKELQHKNLEERVRTNRGTCLHNEAQWRRKGWIGQTQKEDFAKQKGLSTCCRRTGNKNAHRDDPERSHSYGRWNSDSQLWGWFRRGARSYLRRRHQGNQSAEDPKGSYQRVGLAGSGKSLAGRPIRQIRLTEKWQAIRARGN